MTNEPSKLPFVLCQCGKKCLVPLPPAQPDPAIVEAKLQNTILQTAFTILQKLIASSRSRPQIGDLALIMRDLLERKGQAVKPTFELQQGLAEYLGRAPQSISRTQSDLERWFFAELGIELG